MTFATQISRRRIEALEQVDAMSPGLRQCVHEFGVPIVTVLTKFGIREPAHIREIVNMIWLGARQDSQRTGAINAIDFLLARGPVSSATLIRLLAENSMVITTVEPTKAMVAASMAEVSGFNVTCTKEEKHRRRLHAALRTLLPKAKSA